MVVLAGSCTLPECRNGFGVAAERRDVLPDPLERDSLVDQASVSGEPGVPEGLRVEESMDTQTVTMMLSAIHHLACFSSPFIDWDFITSGLPPASSGDVLDGDADDGLAYFHRESDELLKVNLRLVVVSEHEGAAVDEHDDGQSICRFRPPRHRDVEIQPLRGRHAWKRRLLQRLLDNCKLLVESHLCCYDGWTNHGARRGSSC